MKKIDDHTYTLILSVRNTSGVLVRCIQAFNRRGHNIESLHVETTKSTPHIASITITAFGSKKTVHQIVMQLRKLIDVMDVIRQDQS